jgi:hypothetical protein
VCQREWQATEIIGKASRSFTIARSSIGNKHHVYAAVVMLGPHCGRMATWSAVGQLREWVGLAARVRRTPNNRRYRCGADDARHVPLAVELNARLSA